MGDVNDDDDDGFVYVPLKRRREREAQLLSSAHNSRAVRRLADSVEPIVEVPVAPERSTKTLVEVSHEIHAATSSKDDRQETVEEEEFLTRNLIAGRGPLLSAAERAGDSVPKERMTTLWTPPSFIRSMTEDQVDAVRKDRRIHVEGDDIMPPIQRFRDMKFPKAILDALTRKGIVNPTPIQMQGLPIALSRRDMIGIASTGSGKTITFVLPMIMSALEAEIRLPLTSGEGPIGLVVCPSRELAQQTFNIVVEFCAALGKSRRVTLNALLCIGGIDMRDQVDPRRSPVHIVVATPGRLMDMLSKKRLNLDICTFLTLDEADRMIDLGFADDVRTIFGYFSGPRQTVMFSATMPAKIKQFAATSLVDPIVVNVGRAGAASLDVVQHVEYVKEENRMVYILECLQKTAPPVLIFCSNVSDVDDIEEYLLIKGVEAVSIHGGKSQAERQAAIRAFQSGAKDVLVATDIASKGLDFPDIQHVINFDMPKEIEDYVHRIGRTGRRGKTGLATTLINRNCHETTLLDLKYLLMEAKQPIPPMLMTLQDSSLSAGGCPYCGGLGHRVTECPKYMAHSKEKMKASMGGGGDGLSGGY